LITLPVAILCINYFKNSGYINNIMEQRHREYYRLLGLKNAAEPALLAITGVVKVSVGLKMDGIKPTPDMCYKVYVDNTLAPPASPPGPQVPANIGGVPTEVIELSAKVSGSVKLDEGKYRPLIGGTRVFSSRGPGPGTLGCFAIDDTTNKVVLLTNYHVLMANGEEKGHQVAQPDFCCDYCPCRCGEMAKLERGFWGDKNVDCAIATLSNGFENKWTNQVVRLGYISCIPVNPLKEPVDPETGSLTDATSNLPYQPVKPGDTVFKRGINSRLSEGVVVDPTGASTIQFNSKNGIVKYTFLNQIIVAPKNPKRPFSKKGDSGAVVLNHLNQVVGLHFADNETRNSKGKVIHKATESIANPIQDVLKVLQITIPDTGTLLTLPIQWDEAEEIQTSQRDVLDEVTAMIEQHAHGPELIDAFTSFRHEVMQLINHKREVTVAWHRHQGPVFVAHLLEKGKNPAHEMPLAIQGITWQRLLSKMSVVLEKNGTPELAAAIDQYTAKTLGLLKDLFHTVNQRLHQQQ
jgi:hypothetical protein